MGYKVNPEDRRVFEREISKSNFGLGCSDMIEFILFDSSENQLPQGDDGKMVRYIYLDDVNINDYFIISDNQFTKKKNGTPEFIVDIEKLIREAGYSNGIFKTQVTLLNRRAGTDVNDDDNNLWVHEISPSRTEIRLLPNRAKRKNKDLEKRYSVFTDAGTFRDDVIYYVNVFIENLDLEKILQDFLMSKGNESEGVEYINLIKTEFKIPSFEILINRIKTKFIESNSSQATVKMTTTGHGFDNSASAAEFKPIDYFVKVDGTLTHTQYNWDEDCGENPIFPQGGTWIYDRANWCPGKRAQAFDHDITTHITAGDSIELNIDFQSYSWSGTQTPSYIIECQLFQYENANFSNSVEIIDIIKPSLKDEYSRKNPICGKPLITIRNYGSSPLTALDIEYKVVGGSIHTYNWTGNLAFLETEDVELPNLSNWAGSENTFEVILSNPNGQIDDYTANNTMQSEFEQVPEYPENFVLFVNTNSGAIGSSQISETSWDFYNENGNIEYSSGNLIVNSDYKDTLTFTKGCYTFVMNDTDEDGLDFWANNDGGGLVRFREIGASWLKAFDPDFGTNIIHQFTVGNVQTTTSAEQNSNWEIYPNPTKKILIIEGISNEKTKLTLQDNLGKIILERTITYSGFTTEIINLEQFENGIYFIKISNSKEEITKKVVKI